jgi:hypothetical protein
MWEQEGLEQEKFHNERRAAAGTEVTQQNIADRLQLVEEDLDFSF